jgi:pyruvate-ferredoxin/flavodoxin oxidoreductase
MDRFASLAGRHYHLFDYIGVPSAERVIILMGSGAETVEETVDYLIRQGESIGAIKVRLYRPLSAEALIAALPASCTNIAVLDRTKEPGADGEPLYKDVVTAIAQYFCSGDCKFANIPRIIGGRYGLSSKEFTPAMVKAVFDHLNLAKQKNPFTIGIYDDVSHHSLDWDEDFRTDAHSNTFQALFFGLGSDGTVSANKNSIKIIGENTDLHAQGYFVYDSKKSGAVTISHLRFGSAPIHSTYLIADNDANFVACHQPVFLERYDMLDLTTESAVFLLNSPADCETVWDTLPKKMQQQIIDKQIDFYSIDAMRLQKKQGWANASIPLCKPVFLQSQIFCPRMKLF